MDWNTDDDAKSEPNDDNIPVKTSQQGKLIGSTGTSSESVDTDNTSSVNDKLYTGSNSSASGEGSGQMTVQKVNRCMQKLALLSYPLDL